MAGIHLVIEKDSIPLATFVLYNSYLCNFIGMLDSCKHTRIQSVYEGKYP